MMHHTHTGCGRLNGPRPDRQEAARRLEEFAKRLAPNSVAIIVSNPEQTRSNDTEYKYRQSSDILYLNGFAEPQSALVVTNFGGKTRLTMLVRPKDRKQEIWTGIREGVEGARKRYGADKAYTVDRFDEVVGKLIARADHVYYKFGRNGEFDEKFRDLWQDTQKELSNPETIIHEMRLHKSEQELALMRHAAAISAEAHREAMAFCKPGLKEYQLQAILECCFTFHGAGAPAYDSIVAGGNNAVVLHYTSNRDTLEEGALVLVDAACEYEGYASDITRTYPVNGRFSKPQAEIYNLVLKAQMAAIKAARPGVRLGKLHKIAGKVMAEGLVELGILSKSALKNGKAKGKKKVCLADFFMHGTSHWMGIDVHDVGSYGTADGTRSDKGKGKRRILEPGMVFTVEPGLYFDAADKRVPKRYRGIGVRIEDDVVITADGCVVLTAAVPKTIEEIEALMARR